MIEEGVEMGPGPCGIRGRKETTHKPTELVGKARRISTTGLVLGLLGAEMPGNVFSGA